MTITIALIAGLLSDAGPIVSGVVNPAKVLGSLDLFGQWDPPLAFVMAEAIAVDMIAFFMVRRCGHSQLGMPIRLPSTTGVTTRFVFGNAAFDIGWGLIGSYPGSALVAPGTGVLKVVDFVAVMLAGMAVFNWLQRKRQTGGSAVNKPVTHLQRTT